MNIVLVLTMRKHGMCTSLNALQKWTLLFHFEICHITGLQNHFMLTLKNDDMVLVYICEHAGWRPWLVLVIHQFLHVHLIYCSSVFLSSICTLNPDFFLMFFHGRWSSCVKLRSLKWQLTGSTSWVTSTVCRIWVVWMC